MPALEFRERLSNEIKLCLAVQICMDLNSYFLIFLDQEFFQMFILVITAHGYQKRKNQDRVHQNSRDKNTDTVASGSLDTASEAKWFQRKQNLN